MEKSGFGDLHEQLSEEDAVSHDLENSSDSNFRNLTETEGNVHEKNCEKEQKIAITSLKQGEEDGNKEDKKVEVIPFYKLFSFADSTDILMMIAGVAGALANGATTPLLTILQVGKFIGLTSTFFVAFIVAFFKGWLLTLVMISVIPIIAVCGTIISKVTIKIATLGQKANTETSCM